MSVTSAEFHALKARVEANEAAIEVLEDALDATETGSVQDRLSTIESSMVSINQVTALLSALTDQISTHDSRISSNTNNIAALKGVVDALHKWRVDLRSELVFEEATDEGGATTWSLSNNYDPDATFLVFQADLTLVDPDNITLAADTDEFTSSVALTAGVWVLYFKALPDV